MADSLSEMSPFPYVITEITGGGTVERAVATLDGAQDALAAILVEHGERPGVAPAIPEHGGVLSPLPDGTLIDVTPYRWLDLAACANVHWEDTPECRARVLDGFNARERVA